MAFIVPAICTQIPNVTGGVRLHTNDSKVSSATHSSHGELSTASTKGDLHSTPIHLAKGQCNTDRAVMLPADYEVTRIPGVYTLGPEE
jgi:hypothetical protein